MEFLDVGKLCQVGHCGVKDFLPYECKYCKMVTCGEHRDKHDCNGSRSEPRVVKCTECNREVRAESGQIDQDAINKHRISGDCRKEQKRRLQQKTCQMKRCKEVVLVPFVCATCHNVFCAKHRDSLDHQCQRSYPKQRFTPSHSVIAVY